MTERRSGLMVAQSGGATAVINASLAGVVLEGTESGKFGQVLGATNGIEGVLKESFVDLGSLDSGFLDDLGRTPSSAIGTGRHKLQDVEVDLALDVFVRNRIQAFVLIGGNDSADTVLRLHRRARERDLPVQAIAVPKTVDNDLPVTDHCPGYGSMARAIGNIVRDATWDTLASPDLYPVKVIEVMGRDAGWVAASGGIGFDEAETDLLPIVLVPEQPPVDASEVLDLVADDLRTRRWSVVVVPETLRSVSGHHFGGDEPEYVDPHGHPYFASSGASLAREITQQLGVRARFEKPGSFARMSTLMSSDVDRDEARELGRIATRYAIGGRSGVMPVLRRHPGGAYVVDISEAPVEAIANQVRTLPEAFLPVDRRGATKAFREWVMPILGPSPFPVHVRLGSGGAFGHKLMYPIPLRERTRCGAAFSMRIVAGRPMMVCPLACREERHGSTSCPASTTSNLILMKLWKTR